MKKFTLSEMIDSVSKALFETPIEKNDKWDPVVFGDPSDERNPEFNDEIDPSDYHDVYPGLAVAKRDQNEFEWNDGTPAEDTGEPKRFGLGLPRS